jgi:formylglycine-generating enzyme required for sulfatase activity
MPKSTKQTGVLILRLIGIAIPLCAIVTSQQSPRRVSPTSDISITRKMALVIGNSSYPKATLQNPKNDANAMAATLRNLGFQVTIGLDLTRRQMDEFTGRFADSLQSGDLALFYYSGHGVQVGENYLIPIDYQASSAADLRYEAFPAEQVRDRLEQSPARVRIMILDACRDNPFKGSRGGPAGLKPMTAQAEGTLIAYATAENSTSDDNPREANGIYTKWLLSSLSTPGLSLKQIFEQTKNSVWQQSNRTQRPYIYDGIVGDLVLMQAAASPAPQPGPAAPRVAFDQEAWDAVKNSNDPNALRQFIQEYPQSGYVGVARVKIAALKPATPIATATAPPAPTGAIINRVPQPGSTRVNAKDGQRYVWIPPGSFMMGCSPGDNQCAEVEKPAHKVSITRGFWLGQTPVTQRAFSHVMGVNPSKFEGGDLPVESITWDEATKYCEAVGGRLPTEAQWEYAARAGSTSSQYGDVDAIAWHRGNSGNKTQPVGLKRPNAWDLYDMLGNVHTWLKDWFGEKYYAQQENIDPQGPAYGGKRTLTGASWSNPPLVVRVSNRGGQDPAARFPNVGVRCAMD